MRTSLFVTVLFAGLLAVCGVCASWGMTTGPMLETPGPATTPAKTAFTAENNPTTLAGRGEPDLGDENRPAAWVYVDGREGRFTERDGQWQMQWVIDQPVSPSPTFRVEVYEPLLGSPRDFRCALQTKESADGSMVVYAIRAKEGTFEVGREYSVLKPGGSFVILDKVANTELKEIPPLSPGTYGMAAGIKNAKTDKDALAVTYFTVAGGS